jgi:hypothetical protein
MLLYLSVLVPEVIDDSSLLGFGHSEAEGVDAIHFTF